MQQMINFNYNNTPLRTTNINNNTHFALADVCKILGLGSPHKVAERLDEDDRILIPATDSLGRSQMTTFITEPGLYEVIFRSDKPEAKAFRAWVTHEVLPSIHKRGLYATTETAEAILNDPDVMIRLLQELKDEREAKAKLASKVEADAPKVLLADTITASAVAIHVGTFAKALQQSGIPVGERKLFAWLRENGFLMQRDGQNVPTAAAIKRGYLELTERAIQVNGFSRASVTPKVTGKGQQYFTNRLASEFGQVA